MGPKIPSRCVRSESKIRVCHLGVTENNNSDIPKCCQWLQKVGSTFSVRPKLRIGWTEKLGFGEITEVVHLGGTEFAESVCPRLLMSVLKSEEC